MRAAVSYACLAVLLCAVVFLADRTATHDLLLALYCHLSVCMSVCLCVTLCIVATSNNKCWNKWIP